MKGPISDGGEKSAVIIGQPNVGNTDEPGEFVGGENQGERGMKLKLNITAKQKRKDWVRNER